MYILRNNKSLFQLVAERLVRLKSLGGKNCSLPWYIMTSPMNDAATRAFFADNNYFGLPAEDVVFFPQGVLPCLDNDGKIILETKFKCAMAPDGNGGIWTQLKVAGIASEMKERGIKYIHVFSIDNALVRPADPIFIGYCISENADCGNKVLWKVDASEKVGVTAEINGKPAIVEYSDMDKELCEKVDAAGRLVFGAGNICNHFFTLKFVAETILPSIGNMYHIARKKIPALNDDTCETVKPESNNGLKLESFIFDVFPLSKSMAVLDVERADEFAPIKNAPGSPTDSPDTAYVMMSNLAKRQMQHAGFQLAGDLDSTECEISPLISYAGEDLSDAKVHQQWQWVFRNLLCRSPKKTVACPFQL